MGQVFCVSDTHADFRRIKSFCDRIKTTKEDMLLILGDVGLNYFLDKRDDMNKEYVENLPITILCIHGNHEERAYNLPSYKRVYEPRIKAYVYKEPSYPSILFIEDGIFYLGDKKCLAIGGAYSIDKLFRLKAGYRWFESEQPTEEEKEKILKIVDGENSFNYIFSHTVPLKFERELKHLFLPFVNQSTVDKSTEEFLDKVEDRIKYDHWYFGHYHADLNLTDKVTILYMSIIELNL